MNLQFITDPELAPKARDDIRILQVAVTPYQDGRRMKIEIDITPFAPADRPSLEVMARNSAGASVSSLTVIETTQPRLALTLHLRDPEPAGEYTFQTDLYFDPDHVQHSVVTSLALPAASP